MTVRKLVIGFIGFVSPTLLLVWVLFCLSLGFPNVWDSFWEYEALALLVSPISVIFALCFPE